MNTKFLLTMGVASVLALSACAPAVTTPNAQSDTSANATATTSSSASSDSAHAGHTMPSSDAMPSDAMFIDGMIVHHEGAVAMAEEVLAQSERPELLEMADAIIATQTAEIMQMQAWRAEWYPDLAASDGMAMEMGEMEISTDESVPFDQRFLVAMISHHVGAVEMAEAALENTEHEEIRTLANDIITTQSAEIEQMRAWLEEWFGVTE